MCSYQCSCDPGPHHPSHEWAEWDGVGLPGNSHSNISWETSPNSMLYSNLSGATCRIMRDMITFVSSKGIGNVSSEVGVRGEWENGSFLQSWLFLILSISTEMSSLFLSQCIHLTMGGATVSRSHGLSKAGGYWTVAVSIHQPCLSLLQCGNIWTRIILL